MLFNSTHENQETKLLHSLKECNSDSGFISSADDYLSKYVREINLADADKTFHFTSNGRFALHDIIINFAARLPQTNCIVCSFNMSVIAAKCFIRAWDKGMFKSLAFILNAQKRHNFDDAVKLLEGKFTMKFVSIHAKVALLWTENEYITIVTSGNLSNNNNIERGFISTSKEIFDFDKAWIDGIIQS